MRVFRRKPCKDCGQVLSLRSFYKHRSYADGHINVCKRCKIRQVAENKELKADYYREQKRQISARPEYVARRKAYAQSERWRQMRKVCDARYYRLKRLFEARA